MLKLEPAPNDGAPLQCTFVTFVEGEHWQCPRSAAGLLSAADYQKVVEQPIPPGVLIYRAVCATHSRTVREIVGG